MDVGDLKLEPKQRLHWSVQAADRCALAAGPNVGTSQRHVLDVVTAEQLRSMLEARELMLRRRFETIIAELTDTRDLLAGLEFDAPNAKQSSDADETADTVQGEDDPAGESPLRRGPSTAVQVERVLQNSERSGHETRQLATAFDEIREEMINNRVDTEELKLRLKEGISDPLKAIAQNRFPPLVAKLEQLTAQLSESAGGRRVAGRGREANRRDSRRDAERS